MQKVDGNAIKNDIKQQLKADVSETSDTVRLDLFYIGSDSTIETFIALKKQFGEAIGVQVVGHTFTKRASEEKITKSMQTVAESQAVDGMVLQLPVPESFSSELRNLIPIDKDVDVLSDDMRSQFADDDSPILPPVVAAIKEICKRYEINLADKDVAVVGYGELVGKPTAVWLENNNVQYQVYEKGDDLHDLRSADVIMSGAGDPHIITPDVINEQVILFDAGTSQSDGGERGDVHPESYHKAQLVTPVPGGIGPITVAKLFSNLLILSEQ